MEKPVLDAWLHAHPCLGAGVFVMLSFLSIVFLSEMSDGSRGGDASGTGAVNPLGAWLAVIFLILAVLTWVGYF